MTCDVCQALGGGAPPCPLCRKPFTIDDLIRLLPPAPAAAAAAPGAEVLPAMRFSPRHIMPFESRNVCECVCLFENRLG